MQNAEKRNRVLAATVLVVAVALLGIGARGRHKVYDAKVADFGIQPFTWVDDKQMVVDATFGGIELKGGKLVTTYNRLEAGGKRACPT